MIPSTENSEHMSFDVCSDKSKSKETFEVEIKDFIGKVVMAPPKKERYVLTEITSPYIAVKEENNVNSGISIIYDTINGDPFEKGILIFEDTTLTEPFKVAYSAYCCTQDAYYEEIGYWMRRD